jgi:hypothetical protein
MRWFVLTLCWLAVGGRAVPALTQPGWELVFREEFKGTLADLEQNWTFQNGPSGHILCSRWRDNVSVTNGMCRIANRKEKRGGQEWTSGSLWTKAQFLYGYFECRYRYAAAKATNNSFWLMPTGKIPPGMKCFEIDINEGHFPNEVTSNIHNHSDVTVVNGKRTHPTSSRSYSFGVRPDVVIQLEIPVKTRRVRLESTHGSFLHLGEFRIYNVSSAGYPDALSPTADEDTPGLVNFARDPSAKITVSGFLKEGVDTSKNLVDGRVETRWTSRKEGEKWVEFEFPEERRIGCVQFIGGYRSRDEWKSLPDNYRVAYHDGQAWVEMAAFDVKNGAYNFARGFHVFGLEWSEQELVFRLDGKEIRREKNAFCRSPASVWLSEAIIPWAGEVTDAIDGTAMEVDYVRVYRRTP